MSVPNHPAFTANLTLFHHPHRKFPLVQVITDVAKNAIKEKVIRILISTFRNLLVKAPETNGRALLGAKVLPLTESLAARKWSDEEIDEDLQFIIEELKHKLKGMR